MNNGFALAALVGALACVPPAQALDVSLAIGQSSESSMVYRLSLRRDFPRSWWQTDAGRLTGYWDAGYTYWQADETTSNHSLSLAPVFVYEFAGAGIRPYLEAGIGVALFDNSELDGRDLGSAFQFEDRIGAGLRFAGGQELGVRVIHYSNAGLQMPNEGIEAYTLHYRMAF